MNTGILLALVSKLSINNSYSLLFKRSILMYFTALKCLHGKSKRKFVSCHVATDNKDRHRLKIEKLGQFFFPDNKGFITWLKRDLLLD